MTDPGSPPPAPWRDEGSARSEVPPLPRRTPAATRASWPSPPAAPAAPAGRPASPFRQAPVPPARPSPFAAGPATPFAPAPAAPRPGLFTPAHAAPQPGPFAPAHAAPEPGPFAPAQGTPAHAVPVAPAVPAEPVPFARPGVEPAHAAPVVPVEPGPFARPGVAPAVPARGMPGRREVPDGVPPAPRPAPVRERQPVAVAAGAGDPAPARTERAAAELPRRGEPDGRAYGMPTGQEPARQPYAPRPTPDPGPRTPPPPDPPPGPQGAVSLGLGRGSRERELVRRVGVPLPGTRKVVVLSIKGGVGKTTTVAVTGSMLAGLRRDKVVALDASSDWGTLAARLSVVPRQSVREMAARGRHAVSESGVLAQLSSSPSGLLVVGSDPQSAVSAALGEDEYLQAMRLLDYVAGVVVTDVGAGLQQPFLAAALTSCDQLVVASAATWDAAQSAGAALDWLSARGYGHLVESGLVVMNNLYPARRRRQSFVRDMKADLSRRARAVHEIPFDPALQPGGRILLRKLSASTRQAYLEVAADIMSGLAAAPPRG